MGELLSMGYELIEKCLWLRPHNGRLLSKYRYLTIVIQVPCHAVNQHSDSSFPRLKAFQRLAFGVMRSGLGLEEPLEVCHWKDP